MFPEHDMLFSFEFELSSVSVLFVVSFCRFIHVRSGCHKCGKISPDMWQDSSVDRVPHKQK